MATQPQTFSLFLPAIKELLARRALKELRQILQLIGPLDLAQGWESIARENRFPTSSNNTAGTTSATLNHRWPRTSERMTAW